MKPFKSYPAAAKTACAACFVSAFAVASASAVVVAWDLKPGNPKQGAVTSGYDLSSDNKSADVNKPGELPQRNDSPGAMTRGVGFVPTSNSELTTSGAGNQVTYSQFDVRPILGQFVPIPDFGTYQFVSVAAASGPVLPVAFQGSTTPLPRMSVFFPIIGLLVAVSSTQILRRRRAAQIASEA